MQRRLGGQRYQEIMDLMNKAITAQLQSGEVMVHRQWLKRMLLEYYDPMYDYQRDKRQREVNISAHYDGILEYLDKSL